jgi:hypothetical protein
VNRLTIVDHRSSLGRGNTPFFFALTRDALCVRRGPQSTFFGRTISFLSGGHDETGVWRRNSASNKETPAELSGLHCRRCRETLATRAAPENFAPQATILAARAATRCRENRRRWPTPAHGWSQRRNPMAVQHLAELRFSIACFGPQFIGFQLQTEGWPCPTKVFLRSAIQCRWDWRQPVDATSRQSALRPKVR